MARCHHRDVRAPWYAARMKTRISKSRFQKGLQCEKAFWLGVHRRDLAEATSVSQQWIFDQGHEVGRLAQELFPGGVEVTEDHTHPEEALESTRRLIEQGVRVLYEPAFAHGSAFCRADILVAADEGSWDLYEVKSSTSVKEQHVTDAAFQAWTIEGAGLPLRSINVVHVDTGYVYPGGAYDPAGLLTTVDVTSPARAFMPVVPETLAQLEVVLNGPEPDVVIGSRCASPYPCDFKEHCHSFLRGDCPVTSLPRFSDGLLHALLAAGITSCADIPPGFPGLSATQRDAVEVAASGTPWVDHEGLRIDFERLTWPVFHLDFETVAPALPIWPGTRPYQTIPFQYSVHVQQADGTLEERGYLHPGTDDPRPELARRLVVDLAGTGSIVHYTRYERTQLTALALAVPELAGQLAALEGRLFDLEPVVRRRTRHPRAIGRSSIKYALPAWCPDLSYHGLDIGDGQTASARYLRFLTGAADVDEAAATHTALVEYCGLDTLATARLLERLRQLADAEPRP